MMALNLGRNSTGSLKTLLSYDTLKLSANGPELKYLLDCEFGKDSVQDVSIQPCESAT